MQTPKRNRSEIKREAIMLAAKELFQTQGVQGTSMDELARVAEVSKRTVYNHFASKEALVLELVAELWQSANADIQLSFAKDIPVGEQLLEVLNAEIAIMTNPDYLELVRVAIGHFMFHPGALKCELESRVTHESALRRWLCEGVKSGILPKLDVDEVEATLHGMIKGVCFWPSLMQLCEPLPKGELERLGADIAAFFEFKYLSGRS